MKEAKKVQITEQICKQAQLMRRGGANQAEVAALLGINNSTVSRIEAAGFDFGKYQENRKARREKERMKAKAQDQQPEEEQVPGQIEMELITAAEKPAEMSDQVKLMRFQAGQIDKLVLKLDHINDTLSMILRAIRKE